jgi:hypothetical protein
MIKPSHIVLTSLCGLVGTIALTLYFTAPFTWMPLPPETATATEILEFGKQYHLSILIDTWLQQFGTILSVIFALALVHLAKRSKTLPGSLTLLASTVIVSLSLAEGIFVLASVQSGNNGNTASMLTCFQLTYVFIHIFLLAPSLFLMMGFALKRFAFLPKFFVDAAILLGILFQLLGVLALFDNRFIILVIGVLMLQNLWTVSAAIALLTSRNKWTAVQTTSL